MKLKDARTAALGQKLNQRVKSWKWQKNLNCGYAYCVFVFLHARV